MKSLLDCPVETVRSILGYLRVASLRNLCLASRALRDAAEPLLYAKAVFLWLGDDPNPPFMLFFQNLQRRPHLAKYVQSLTFEEGYTGDGWKISVDSSELASLVTIIEDINPPFRDLWIQELRNGTPDAFVMLFLSLAPNLKLLRLAGKFNDDHRLLGGMLRTSLLQTMNCNLPRFQYLQKVELVVPLGSAIRHPEMQNTADILSLFYLPTVQSIAGVIDNPAVFTWPADAPNPSYLTSLHIRGVREGTLGRILATTKNLKKLGWEWKYEPVLRNETNNNIINFDQIIEDLSFVKATLEYLELSGAASGDPELDALPQLQIRGSLKPLRCFEKLQELVIPQQCLTGFSPNNNLGDLEDMMPKNIHHLTITDDMTWLEQNVVGDADVFRLLQHWWQNLQIHTPHFKSLYMCLMHSEWWGKGVGNGLDDLCAQLGIQLKYTFQPPVAGVDDVSVYGGDGTEYYGADDIYDSEDIEDDGADGNYESEDIEDDGAEDDGAEDDGAEDYGADDTEFNVDSEDAVD